MFKEVNMYIVQFYSELLRKYVRKPFKHYEDAKQFSQTVNGIIIAG